MRTGGKALLCTSTALALLATAGLYDRTAEAAPASLTSAQASQAAPGTAANTDTAASVLENGFENAPAGSGYSLDRWAEDGWDAPWSLGMSDRTMIDDSAPARSGDQSLRVLFPEGEISPPNSGAQAPFGLDSAPEYYLSTWMRFDEEFSWGDTLYSGKVGIGLAGGEWCSGGMDCTGTNGFSSRFIWHRASGEAALYYYHMDMEDEYGDYIEMRQDGSVITWPKGEWVNVVQRVKVNTVTNGQANPDGEIEIFYNGERAGGVSGLRFVTNSDQVDTAYFASFAGGGDDRFAPRNDSYVWFDDIKVSTNRADICELDGCA